MEFLDDATWAMVVPTSMGVRLTPDDRQPAHSSDRYVMQATSAESNVASITASLGLPALVLTNFVAGSPISAFIKASLRARGLCFTGPDLPQGGAWGYRHQFNIADSGFGSRGPRVWNDRAGEVGRDLDIAQFDTDTLFGVEGVKVLHLSGLVAALSPGASRFCVELADIAKAHGTAVSFDLNYRASFWQGREDELHAAFDAIARLSDILIGNEEDFQLALGLAGPPAGDTMDGFAGMVARARQAYPNASVLATTVRQVLDANRHLWGAIAAGPGGLHRAGPREIGVLDRVGGGDAFAGGLLYGLLQRWPLDKSMQFGWACGAYAVTTITDYITPADEEAIWSVWNGNARIVR
ncbi:MAG: sugar kinase [Micrococcales bacterium]|nr:sugar kinase [Micrococcales bacterium]